MVLFIAGVLGAIAAPRVFTTNGRARAMAAAQRIAADLEYARNRAITTSSPMTVNFVPGKDVYGMPGLASPLNGRQSTYLVKLNEPPYDCSLRAAAFGEGTGSRWTGVYDADPVQRVVFDGFGKPDSSGWVMVSSGGIICRVSLDESGRATRAEISKEAADVDISASPSGTVATGDLR
jgi:hypothetical protein